MEVYLDWKNCTILFTRNIAVQDAGTSIKFLNIDEMSKYIKKNKCAFKNLKIYDQIGSDDGTIYWLETNIDCV